MSIRLIAFSLVCLAASAAQAAPAARELAESNTVATAELAASMGIMQVPGTDSVEVTVELRETSIDEDGDTVETALTFSENETVLISQGTTTLKYDPNGENLLPYVDSGVYMMTFVRFNGETYTSNVTAPSPIVITAPGEGSSFNRDQAVEVDFKPMDADIFGALLFTYGCADTQGQTDLSATHFVLPAGWASTCTKTQIDERLVILAANFGTEIPGLNGKLLAETESTITFSYPGPERTSRSLSARAHESRHLADLLLKARRDGKKSVVGMFRN